MKGLHVSLGFDCFSSKVFLIPQYRLEVIESKLDRRYEDDVEIPGFSHNEQKNREELEKLAFDLTKCPELKYIQKKDVKRHIVEYLAKKKRKRKSNKKVSFI